jgi:hypothetical protein
MQRFDNAVVALIAVLGGPDDLFAVHQCTCPRSCENQKKQRFFDAAGNAAPRIAPVHRGTPPK